MVGGPINEFCCHILIPYFNKNSFCGETQQKNPSKLLLYNKWNRSKQPHYYLGPDSNNLIKINTSICSWFLMSRTHRKTGKQMDVLILTCSEPWGVLCLLKTAQFNLFLLFFFRYLDRYRDIKDINEEVLQEKLKTVHPFKPSTDPKYPLYRLQLENRGLPSWLKKKRRNATHKVMQWED